jgi:two-component system, LytTR family, sensor kinase
MARAQQPNSFLLTLFGFERVKNKAHVLLIVLIHVTGWCLLFFLPLLMYPVRINDDRFISRELIDKSVLVILFYVNYYLLIPRFFEKKKYFAYFSLVLFAFLIYLVQHVTTRVSYFPGPGEPLRILHFNASPRVGRDSMGANIVYSSFNSTQGVVGVSIADSMMPAPFTMEGRLDSITNRFTPAFRVRQLGLFGLPKGVWLMTLNNAISSFVLLLLMGGFIRLSYSFISNQNEKKALENANLNAEVNFLKSQINPHFLFNTLNTIYAQAHSRSVNTEFSILKLSDLLRYVLYDSGDDKVELAKDIQYINNYIDLQRLRLSKKVSINYAVTGDMQEKRIAPLLLINFIENAFKHGISYSQASTIDISIVIFEETLTLTVINPIIESDRFAPGGLGLKNVSRRLELLYAGKHQLDIQRTDNLHIVNLKLELTNA